MIARDIAKRVLIVGPQHENHRGGIGAVIGAQKDYYTVFNFIPSYQYHSANLLKTLFFISQLAKIFWYLIFHPQIRILHVHSSVNGSLYRKLVVMLLGKFVFRKKIINHLHSGAYDVIYNNGSALQKKIMSRYFKLSDVTITVSDKWKEYIANQFDLKPVYFINNIVIPVPIAQKKVSPSNKITFLFLGLIGDNKGIFDLLEVLAKHREELSDRVRLQVGGNGEIDRLKALISENSLEEIVEFKGWVSGHEKHRLMLDADVFILPSFSEGMPVSVLEAMSYGLPVISTRVGGIPEIVQSDINGKLIEPGDHDALFEAMNHYLRFPDQVRQHGVQSLNIIREYYPSAVIPKIETIYKSLV